MPVLMIALVALAVFGVIGVLLFLAAVMETKTENAHQPEQGVKAAAAGKR